MSYQIQVETFLGYWQTLNRIPANETLQYVSVRLADISRSNPGKRVRAIDSTGRLVDIRG